MGKDYTPSAKILEIEPTTGVDVVGDIHGCMPELLEVVARAGYHVSRDANERDFNISHPKGRMLFFVGDLTDRGPNSLDVLRFTKNLIESGVGGSVIGNHDYKLLKVLNGHDLQLRNGLQETIEELSHATTEEVDGLRAMLKGLPTQILIRRPRMPEILIVHASAHEHHQMMAQNSSFHRSIFGYPGPVGDDGYPIRGDWAADYQGERHVIHGHVANLKPVCKNNVINLDTGCAFGGALTLQQVYEQNLIEVKARETYSYREQFA